MENAALYVIRFANSQNQTGYYMEIARLLGRFAVSNDVSGAAFYHTEEDAEADLYRLQSEFGISVEEGNIECCAAPKRSFKLRLHECEDANSDDYIAVVEEGTKRYIDVHNTCFAAADEIPEEVADLLVKVLWKLQVQLATRSRKGA